MDVYISNMVFQSDTTTNYLKYAVVQKFMYHDINMVFQNTMVIPWFSLNNLQSPWYINQSTVALPSATINIP